MFENDSIPSLKTIHFLFVLTLPRVAALQTYLRNAPQIRQEEERNRRQHMKRAMQPFVNLVMNKRTVGVQTTFDKHGRWTGSNRLRAEFGRPGSNRSVIQVRTPPTIFQYMPLREVLLCFYGRILKYMTFVNFSSQTLIRLLAFWSVR